MTAEECREAILLAESIAAAGIERDLEGLHGLVSASPIEFIESRWLRWLDAKIQKVQKAYYDALGD